MNKTTIGIAMGAAALGMALGYYSQPSTPVAMACDPLVLAPGPVREAEPVKDLAQRVAPMEITPGPNTKITARGSVLTFSAVASEPAKANLKTPVAGILLKASGDNCAWIHKIGAQWKAESLVHFGQSSTYSTYEQAVRLTKEGWCGK